MHILSVTVEILLSVYKPNPAYLIQQINSLIAQNGVSVKISIRDDTGSSEHYRELSKIISDSYSNCMNISVTFGDNIGPAWSFYNLCETSTLECDYYAFCDQDDIWQENKLFNAISSLNANGAGLYASTLNIVDANLKYIKTTSVPKNIGFRNSLAENVVTGCATVFTKDIMILMRKCRPSYISMHDHWAYMLASAFSTIYFDENSYIQYRQHGGNVVGATGMKYYYNKSYRFIRSIFSDSKRTSDQVLEFRSCFRKQIDEKLAREVDLYLRARNNALIRFATIFRYNRNGFIENCIFKVKYILGLY